MRVGDARRHLQYVLAKTLKASAVVPKRLVDGQFLHLLVRTAIHHGRNSLVVEQFLDVHTSFALRTYAQG